MIVALRSVRCRRKLEDHSRLLKNCRDFFIEFVTDICSSTQKPDKSFVEELTRIVCMGESDEYKELYPVELESKESSCPIIRSFLLQFLLEKRYVHSSLVPRSHFHGCGLGTEHAID